MLKANTHPESQLNRVRGVLHALVDHPIAGEWAKKALACDDKVYFYRYLYNVAEACNPFPRSDFRWRRLCMQHAYSNKPIVSNEMQARCKLAAIFYLLSEGLYSQPTLPSLT